MATTFLKMENLVESTLDGAILAGDGTLDVQAGEAANFGAVDYHIVVGDESQGFEVMTVTNVVADTMTIGRAAENVGGGAGVALPFDDGTAVRLAITDQYMQDAYDAINNIENGVTTLTSVTTTGAATIGTDLTLELGANQDYLFTNRGDALAIQAQDAATPSILELNSADGDGTDIIRFNAYAVGTPGSNVNRERLQMGWDPALTAFEVSTEAGGTGTLRPLVLFTEGNANQLLLPIDGTVSASGAFSAASIGTAGAVTGASFSTAGDLRVGSGAVADGRVTFGSDDDVYIHGETADTELSFVAGLVTTTSDMLIAGAALKNAESDFEVQGTYGYLTIVRDDAGDNGPTIYGYKSDNDAIVTDNAILLNLYGQGHDGGDYETVGAAIRMTINGAPAANRLPTDVEIWTALGGADNDVQIAATFGKDKSLTVVGDVTINGNTISNDTGPVIEMTTGTVNTVLAGTLAVNGAALTSDDATFGLLDVTPTTINFGGAATTMAIGQAITLATADTTLLGDLQVNGNDIKDGNGDTVITMSGDGNADATFAGSIFSSDHVIIEGTTLIDNNAVLEVQGATGRMALCRTSDDEYAPGFYFIKGHDGICVDDDTLATIAAKGHDGGDYGTFGGQINFVVNGTPEANKMPTDIEIWTAAGTGNNDNALCATFGKDKNLTVVGDTTTQGGDFVAGVDGTTRGTITLWDGAAGNTPGYIKIGSPNGTIWYLFVEDDGTVKVHNAVPTQNADGSAVGDQTD